MKSKVVKTEFIAVAHSKEGYCLKRAVLPMMIMMVVVMMMKMISVPAYITHCGTRNPIRSYLLSDGVYVSVHLLETKYLTNKLEA
jgi:hypothetical protein